MCKNVQQRTNNVQHFSTRIPWKDNDYTGRIDNNPRYNVAAQVIPNIASSRNLELEEANKGRRYEQVGSVKMQSWIIGVKPIFLILLYATREKLLI